MGETAPILIGMDTPTPGGDDRAFTLPHGYAAPDGRIHREGTMRRALAADEILPLEDPRVRSNRAYLVILLLARVITRLGDLERDRITPSIIEGLYSSDLAYLQALYREVNGLDGAGGMVRCPHCGQTFSPSSGPATE
jgi:hypothetical protein